MAGPYICEGVQTCALCGCTDDMGCLVAHGWPCGWSAVKPEVCTACERAALAIQAYSEEVNAPGATGKTMVAAFLRACHSHREQGYG